MTDNEFTPDNMVITVVNANNPHYLKHGKITDYDAEDDRVYYTLDDGTKGSEKFGGIRTGIVNDSNPIIGVNTFLDENNVKDKNMNVTQLPTTFFLPKGFNVSLMNNPLNVVPDVELDGRFLASTIPGTYQLIKIEDDILYYDNIDRVKPVVIAGTAEAFYEAINKNWILPRGTWGNSQY